MEKYVLYGRTQDGIVQRAKDSILLAFFSAVYSVAVFVLKQRKALNA
jgi:hypothetical protein